MLLLLAPVVRCQEQSPFEMLGESGLEGFDARCGLPDKTHIFEVNGGGLGLEDLNGDGLLDLVAVGGSTVETLRKGEPGTRPQVFFGRGDGGFSPAGKAWELAPLPWGTGLALGDLDGDGHCDLVLASIGGLAVYRNQGGTGFEALPAPTIDGWPTSLALFDLEGDGDLDLFVVRYLKPDLRAIPAKGSGGAIWKGHPVLFGPEGLEPEADLLFLGDGTGAFTAADAALSAAPPAFGLGIVATDFDRDGDTDLYVSNDSCPNHLWRNDGGQLVEVGFASGTSHAADGREQAGMGIAVGCLGDDGTPSLFVTNFSGESNALYRPRARSGGYRERSARLGIALASHDRLGWGTGFSDIDFDGDLDLWVLNGHVYPEADWAGTDTKYAQADQVLWQGAEGAFVAAPLCAAAPWVSRAGVAGDLDGDGDEDLVCWTMDRGLVVLRNTAPKRGTWMAVELEQPGRNPGALGAWIEVQSPRGTQRAEVQRTAGFQASKPARCTFGLGTIEGPVPVRITWPGGQGQELSLQPGRLHRVQRKDP
ncbi:MAG: CRTAC1 family protein [Planctomycetota bacterium]